MRTPSEQMLTALWQRGLPRLHSRLDLLDRAAASAVAGTLARDVREQAAETAHKLAGSLGMFGYTQGTGLAREIEVLLEAAGEVDTIQLRALTAALRKTLNVHAVTHG